MGHYKGYFEGAKTFLVPLTRKMREIRKLGMNLLGTLYKAKGNKRKKITEIFSARTLF
jgi:hypothetical protein